MAEITDAMVADIVMGWRLDGCEWVDSNGVYTAQADDAFIEPMFTPTTDIAKAFQVDAEVYKKKGYRLMLHRRTGGGFTACYVDKFGAPVTDWMNGPKPAMAICKAAIEALESQNKAKMSDKGDCGSRISDNANGR